MVYDIDPDKAIGLDMSMHAFYVGSNGNTVDTPHPYLRSQDRLAKEQRKLSHLKKGSSNYRKQNQKIAVSIRLGQGSSGDPWPVS